MKEWHNLQCSQKNTRRLSREENQAQLAGNTSIGVATHADAANVTTDGSCQQAIRLPHFDFRSTRFFTPYTAKYYPMNGRCVGMMSQTIDYFASLSNENKGICLTYWSFLDNRFRSNDCNITVEYIGGQCKNCAEAKVNLRARSHPELFGFMSANKVDEAEILVSQLKAQRIITTVNSDFNL